MSMLRSVLTYMGLGPDEDYDDGYLYEAGGSAADALDDEEEEVDGEETTIDVRDGRDPHSQRPRPDWLEPSSPFGATTETRRRKISIDDDDPDGGHARRGRHDLDPAADQIRSLRAVPATDGEGSGDGITVRPVASSDPEPQRATTPTGPRQVKPRALAPQSFGEAKILADEFKNAVPVIMNLQGIERDLARRLIDFASGVCYALDGGMEKIASQVFLLTPKSVEVSQEERRRIEQRVSSADSR